MANLSKKEKVVYHYNLELTEEEAKTLLAILNNVSGSLENSLRKHANEVHTVLSKEFHVYSGHLFEKTSCGLYFVDGNVDYFKN